MCRGVGEGGRGVSTFGGTNFFLSDLGVAVSEPEDAITEMTVIKMTKTATVATPTMILRRC